MEPIPSLDKELWPETQEWLELSSEVSLPGWMKEHWQGIQA